MKAEVEYRLNILDIAAIIIAICSIFISIFLAYHVNNLHNTSLRIEKHLKENKKK